MKNSILYYSVGPLLYCPALSENISDSLSKEKFGRHFSLALCLEDTIRDHCVKEAEEQLISSLQDLYQKAEFQNFFMPKLFIRVRNSGQIGRLFRRLGHAASLVTGFIIPKFDLNHADEYIQAILSVNKISSQPVYMMPILESPTIIHLQSRISILYELKKKLDALEELVLNIRVGGNDLCHMFGFRRSSRESIHEIRPISHIFSDIITVFSMDYIVSGPVWEYYQGNHWDTGLERELIGDRQCGFIGKTIIHPNQIDLVNKAYMVSRKDYEDACAILHWDSSSHSLVSSSSSGERMNEYKTHYHWARKILMLSEIYGILPEKHSFL